MAPPYLDLVELNPVTLLHTANPHIVLPLGLDIPLVLGRGHPVPHTRRESLVRLERRVEAVSRRQGGKWRILNVHERARLEGDAKVRVILGLPSAHDGPDGVVVLRGEGVHLGALNVADRTGEGRAWALDGRVGNNREKRVPATRFSESPEPQEYIPVGRSDSLGIDVRDVERAD